MINKKADNQWYGKGFEQAIYMIFNKLPQSNPYPQHINEGDWTDMIKDAFIFISQYDEIINSCEWIGNKTKIEDGDLIINHKKVEVKRVSENKGTYLNTSWKNCADKYGFELNSQKFLHENNLYNELERQFGKDAFNTENASPFTQDESSKIQKEYKEWYKKYSKLESIAREKAVTKIVTKLKNNNDLTALFLNDIISKNISNKNMPEKLVVYNYIKKMITFNYDNKTLKCMNKNYSVSQSSRQKLGFNIGNFRIQIGWQNGAGLNNPTIRVFIK